MSESLPRAFGPFVLSRALGAGSGGSVYLARPGSDLVDWPSRLVIKLLHADANRDASYVARFKHEAEVAVRVDHRNVVRVLDAGMMDDRYYITMEHVTGRTLASIRSDLFDRQAALPLPIAANILRQILDGLLALHSITDDRGVSIKFVHRDLSPRNIMVADDGRVRLIDLGLGKSSLQDWQTRVGTTLGSAGYMPPEQAAGDPVDQSADTYAIGAIAYELFSGQRMIALGEVMQMLHATIAHVHVPINTLRPEVPDGIDAMARRATAHLPHDRYKDVDGFLADLIAAGVPTATNDDVAAHLKALFGAVEPVPMGPEDVHTDPTQAGGPFTVLARREGLVGPRSLMFHATRADASPLVTPVLEPTRAEPLSASFAQPPKSNRVVWVAGTLVLAALAAASAVMLATDRIETAVLPARPVVQVEPGVRVQPRARAHDKPPVVAPPATTDRPPLTKAPPLRTKTRPAPPTRTDPTAPTVPDPKSVRMSAIERIERRANGMRAKTDITKEARQAAAKLSMDAFRVRGAIETPDADDQIRALDKRLAKLEAEISSRGRTASPRNP